MIKKCSARGHQGVSQGSPRGQVGVNHSVYSVRDVFKLSNIVQICVKRVRNTLKQCSKSGQPGVSQGSPGVQPGGQPGFSQGSGRSQPRVSQKSPLTMRSARVHQGVSQGVT